MAVESLERSEQLLERWCAFTARGEARLLIWELPAYDVPLIEAFVARENEADAARTSDLILPLETPYVDGLHTTRLVGELCEQFEELSSVRPDDLLQALCLLRDQCWPEGAQAKLAVWLRPRAVSDEGAYCQWLGELIARAPDELRFLVLECDGSRLHAPLARTHGSLVVRESCRHEVGDLFRRARTRMARCLRAGDRTGAARASAEVMALVDPRQPSRAESLLLTLSGGFTRRRGGAQKPT